MLYAKLEKCQFSVQRIEFLGYVISDVGIEMDPNRTASISNWPTPTKIKELQSFLGFTNFYRMFIPNYTENIKPLLQLLKKNVPFQWSDECQASMTKLHEAFIHGDILVHADTTKPFILEADASDFALGGILSQEYDGIWRPVAFYSRKLTPAEINYEIHDKELLAIIACFYQWRALLLSNEEPIQVYTDHRNLLYYTSTRKLNCRQARWSTFLSNFNYNIIYCAGKECRKPDALSRRNDYQLQGDDEQVQIQNKTLLDQNKFLLADTRVRNKSLLDEIISTQNDDPLIQELQGEGTITLMDKIWYFQGKIVIPYNMIQKILQECHDKTLVGHPGSRKTFQFVNRTYWWPSIRKDVNDYVQSCDICSRAKPIRMKPAGLLQPLPTAPRPWFSISMDFITDLPPVDGYDSILVIVDRFSKMAHFIPCTKTITSTGLSTLFINNIVRIHGLPNDIVSNQGPQFNSQFWNATLKNLNIQCNLSSAFHPQSDGQMERTNQTLEQYLRIYADPDQLNWVSNLPLAELAYNSTYHDSIEMSPFMATYGFEPSTNMDTELVPNTPPTVVEWITRINDNHQLAKIQLDWTANQMKKYADCKRCHVEFQVGDLVFLNWQNIPTKCPCRKLDWKQFGPFSILEKINPVTYQLNLPQSFGRIHNAFHVSLLSKKKQSTLIGRTNENPPPLLVDNDGELYEVEDILDSKKIDGKIKYLIAWKGYGPADNTWEPEQNLTDCRELLLEFKREH